MADSLALQRLPLRLIAGNNYKFFVLFCLYIAQAVPGSFFDTAIPVLLRQGGFELGQISILKLAALPAAFKFLWAPLVDKYGFGSFGSYKSWIFPMQALTILCTLALTQFDWLANFGLLMLLAVTWTLAGATQDIGVDGLAVRSLTKHERPTGVAIQNFSALLGALLGGGVMVIALGRLGFNNAILIVTVVLLIPFLVLMTYREPAVPVDKQAIGMKSISEIFRRKGMLLWMLQIVLLIGGSAFASVMVTPMLVDQGFEIEKFGMLYGVIIPIVGAFAAILAPFLINRFGRKAVILGSACFLCLDLFNLILIDQLEPALWAIFAILSWGAFTNVFLLIGISSVFMDLCRPETAATDWTVQMSILGLAGILFSGAGGFVAEAVGYSGLFLLGLLFTVAGIAVVARYLNEGYLVHDPDF